MCPYTFKRNDRCQSVYEESPFESIPAACWWCIVTMTTVGYGDMYPTGWVGKLLGCIVMMCGILVIALPITVIGSNFAVVYKVLLSLFGAVLRPACCERPSVLGCKCRAAVTFSVARDSERRLRVR